MIGSPTPFNELRNHVDTGPRYSVRFTRRWNSYFAGDVATFPMRLATSLVRDRFAERVNVVSTGTLPEGAILATRYPITAEARRKRE